MASLAMETPKAHHLQRNAEPVLAAIDRVITELQAARAAFSPTHDSRPSIDALSHKISDLASQLIEVTGEDLTAKDAEAAWRARSDQFSAMLKTIRLHVPQIGGSEQEGTSTARKRLNRGLQEAADQLTAFSQGTDSRRDMAKAIEMVKAQVGELTMLDPALDRWAPRMVMDSCDTLLRVLEQPVPTSLPRPNDAQPVLGPADSSAEALNAMTTFTPTIATRISRAFGWAD